VGVNADPQEANDRFRRSLGLPFPLVGDPAGAILRAYKVRWPIIGIAKRVTYVVGGNGKILSAYRNERDMTAHAAQACEFVGGVGAR
jgi:peroxiredoxin Q/BCP